MTRWSNLSSNAERSLKMRTRALDGVTTEHLLMTLKTPVFMEWGIIAGCRMKET
jgi:hypothetical protein